MVCRRWRVVAAVVLLACMQGATSPVLAAGAPAVVPTAKDFETAPVGDLPKMRQDVLASGASLLPTAKAAWAVEIAKDFNGGAPGIAAPAKQGVHSDKPEVRLNAAILIGSLNTITIDGYLMDMLKNGDSTVRYWGAKGLGTPTMVKSITDAGGAARVIKALGDAATVGPPAAAGKGEPSGVVSLELIKTLVSYGSGAGAGGALPPLMGALNAVAGQMAANTPDLPMLQTAAEGLGAIEKSVGAATPADKDKAAEIAANLASYATQQLVKFETALKGSGDPVPADYVTAVKNVVNSAAAVCRAAGAKSLKVTPGATAAEMLMNVNTAFGKDLQKEMPKVPAPKTLP